ncbi:MAG: hypothetical protein J0H57_13195, partial [Rhodospirillales bacterium]|nr:hypothetical protein [Rhodospirillales bacterium]
MHADHLENGAHCAACDDARTSRSRAQDHLAGAVTADAIVMKRARVAERYAKKVALCAFGRLADRLR